MVAQGQWGPDNATALESSRAPAGPTATAGQRAEGFCTVRGSNHTSPLRGSRVVQGYIQTISLPLRTKGFCILFKESSFRRVKGNTPRTEVAEDWQRPALTHQAEMQGSTDKAQSVLWHPGTMWSLCCCRLPSRLPHTISLPALIMPPSSLCPQPYSFCCNPTYEPDFETLPLN